MLPEAVASSQSAQEQTSPRVVVEDMFALPFIRFSILLSGDDRHGAGEAAGG